MIETLSYFYQTISHKYQSNTKAGKHANGKFSSAYYIKICKNCQNYDTNYIIG